MLSHPMEPVLGVAVIGFAAVHDGVQVAPVRAGKVLGDAMRGIQMVVPKQDCGANGFVDGGGECGAAEVLVQFLVQSSQRQHRGPWTWPKVWRLRRVEELAKCFKGGHWV